MKIKRIAIDAMLLAIAIVLNIVESFIPSFIPGVKLGLANIIVLLMLYEATFKEAFGIMILRIILVGLLRGNIFQLQWWMSLSGGLFSFFVMFGFSKIKVFSCIGVSVLGAMFHCLGQIIVAMFVLEMSAIIYYLPFIALLSVATGILTGIITKVLINRKILNKFITEES